MKSKKQTPSRSTDAQPVQNKPVRVFASFQNKAEQLEAWEDTVVTMSGSELSKLCMYLGRLQSTIAEGYSDPE